MCLSSSSSLGDGLMLGQAEGEPGGHLNQMDAFGIAKCIWRMWWPSGWALGCCLCFVSLFRSCEFHINTAGCTCRMHCRMHSSSLPSIPGPPPRTTCCLLFALLELILLTSTDCSFHIFGQCIQFKFLLINSCYPQYNWAIGSFCRGLRPGWWQVEKKRNSKLKSLSNRLCAHGK